MPSQPIQKIQFPVFLLTLGLAIGNPCCASAFQDDDPFGNGPAKQQDVNDDPFGDNANKTPAKSKSPGNRAVNLPDSNNKVVLAIRETNPSTPPELINAIRIMFDTRNYEEAKSYLDKLIAASVNDAVAFELVEKIGSDFIIRLMRSEQMSPLGSSFGRKLLTSANRHITSDAQLKVLFNDLTSQSVTKRINAQRGFRLAGIPGLNHLLQNGPNADPSRQTIYQEMAASISSRVVEPLQAVLETGSDPQKIFATAVLGLTQSKKSVPFLLAPLMSPGSSAPLRSVAKTAFKQILGGQPEIIEAKRFLRKQIDQLIDGATPFDLDGFDMAMNWNWSSDGKLTSIKIESDIARIVRLERLARILYDIDPKDPNSERTYLATQLTAIKTLAKKPFEEVIKEQKLDSIPSEKWIAVLEFCLKRKLYDGAIGAVSIISKVMDESILQSADFSPLVKAMESGDRQLRFASTQAIIRLKPKRAFPGANKFMDSLVFFAATRGTRRVLVAHPKISEGQSLVGALSQRGLDADAATTGRGIYRLALEDPDVEFLLISDAVDHPPLGELLGQLRSNPALAEIPIGILSQNRLHQRNLELAAVDKNTIALRHPYRVSFRVEQLLPVDNAEINNAIISWTVFSDILEQALDQNNRSVAIQTLDTMKEAYNDNLSKLDVDNSAIFQAVNNSDKSIRSKAARLYLRINGEKPIYEKPSVQPSTSGRVMVIHPRGTELQPMINLMKKVGFTVSTFGSVNTAIQAIPSITNLKFVIASTEFGGPETTEIKDALKEKYRLNPIPISFVDRADSYREAPVAKPVFDTQIDMLIELNGRETTELIRIQQARISLAFLYEIIRDRQSYDYLNPIRQEQNLVESLQNPALATQALKVLGELATPNSQTAIVDFASDGTQSPTLRKSANAAFKVAVAKRGILLTKADILKQYDRYNASESLDKETQLILAEILDIMENVAK